MIDAIKRDVAKPGSQRAMVGGGNLSVPKFSGQESEGRRSGKRIEVSAENGRFPAVGMSEPFGAQKDFGLDRALPTGNSQVGIYQLEFPSVQPYSDPQYPPGFTPGPVREARKPTGLD